MGKQVGINQPCPVHGVAFAKHLCEGKNKIIICSAPKIMKYYEVDPYTGEVIEKERVSYCWHHLSGYSVKKRVGNLCADCKKKPRVEGNSYCRDCKNRRHKEMRMNNPERFREYKKKYRSKRRDAA